MSWEDIFELIVSAAAKEFCVWVQALIDVYTPHHKYLVKRQLSLWFSAACSRLHSKGMFAQNYKLLNPSLLFISVCFTCTPYNIHSV